RVGWPAERAAQHEHEDQQVEQPAQILELVEPTHETVPASTIGLAIRGDPRVRPPRMDQLVSVSPRRGSASPPPDSPSASVSEAASASASAAASASASA